MVVLAKGSLTCFDTESINRTKISCSCRAPGKWNGNYRGGLKYVAFIVQYHKVTIFFKKCKREEQEEFIRGELIKLNYCAPVFKYYPGCMQINCIKDLSLKGSGKSKWKYKLCGLN